MRLLSVGEILAKSVLGPSARRTFGPRAGSGSAVFRALTTVKRTLIGYVSTLELQRLQGERP